MGAFTIIDGIEKCERNVLPVINNLSKTVKWRWKTATVVLQALCGTYGSARRAFGGIALCICPPRFYGHSIGPASAPYFRIPGSTITFKISILCPQPNAVRVFARSPGHCSVPPCACLQQNHWPTRVFMTFVMVRSVQL